MNNPKTPKIVVGVVLAALYATALAAALIPRGAHDPEVAANQVAANEVAANVSADPATQFAAESDPTGTIIPAPADASSVPANQPVPAAAVAAPMASASLGGDARPATGDAASVPTNDMAEQHPPMAPAAENTIESDGALESGDRESEPE